MLPSGNKDFIIIIIIIDILLICTTTTFVFLYYIPHLLPYTYVVKKEKIILINNHGFLQQINYK